MVLLLALACSADKPGSDSTSGVDGSDTGTDTAPGSGGGIRINEIAARNGQCGESDWFELYNSGDAAIEGGMLTLRMDGWLKVLKGVTTLEQVIRETSA